MSETLELQVQLAQKLLVSLNNVISNSTVVSNSFEQQLEISRSFNESLNTFSNRFQTMSNSVFETSQKMQQAFSGDIVPQQAKLGKEIEKSSKSAQVNAEAATTTTQQVADCTDERTGHRKKQTSLSEQRIKSAKRHSYSSKKWVVTDVLFRGIAKLSEEMTKTFNNLNIVKRAAQTGGWSLLLDIPRLIVTGVFKVVGSVIGLTFNFFKLSLSLPFMIADRAVQIGNAFRQDIIVNIGNAYQATKEYSDANSNIGKGITNLRGIVVGSLKTFENPRSLLVKLFGEGAAGASAFLTEVSKAINDMGPLAELLGQQVSNSAESAEFLMISMKGLGLTSKEISYYALDAGVHQENIFNRLERVKVTVSQAAKQHSVDTKQVSLGMQKLRTNIKDFGHLSDQNLSNLVARMRQLNVGAEDLTSVFNKFTSFEEASKTSAMLYQSFQMSIDALDLLTARDPGEIVERFRDAMFATGRDYSDLNRHEKQLMKTTTGMTDAMLKSLMTYQNMGLSYEEAKQKIANDNPTKQQIEAIKKLSSSIKEIQRIMTFKSPFDAFLKGLAKNGAASDKMKSVAISLSKMYESIYLFGLYLDKSAIKAATKPVIMIVTKVNKVFKSKEFKSMLTTGTSAMSNVISFMSKKLGKSGSTKKLVSVLEKVYALEKTKHSSAKADQDKIKNKAQHLLKDADASIKKMLRGKGILTDDDKFVKGVTLQAILSQIKTSSMHMTSKEGKESLKKITDDLSDYTNEITTKYIFDKEFQDNAGIKGLINKTTDDFKKMFDQGGGLFMDIFMLGGKIMGAIIKGFTIAVSSLIYIICGSLDDFSKNNNLGSSIAQVTGQSLTGSKKFNILEWLGITKKEKLDISTGVVQGLRDLVARGGKLIVLGGAALSMFKKVAMSIANMMLGIFSKFLQMAADNDTFVAIALKIKLTRSEKAKIFARATAGVGSLDISDAYDKIKSRENYVHQAGGAFYLDILNKYKDRYSDDVYGKNLRTKALNNLKAEDITTIDFTEIIAAVSKVNYLESHLGYDSFKKIKDAKKKSNVSTILNKKLQNSSLNKNFSELYKKHSNAFENKAERYNPIKIDFLVPSQAAVFNPAATQFLETANNYYKSGLDSKYNSADNLISAENMKDGVISNAKNSIFEKGGLKFIESNGTIISPDSMDELAALSSTTKNSLTQVFSNAALAYQKASEVIVLSKKEKLVNKNASAEDGLVDEVMSMLYETLEISVNRKINVVNNKLEVTS